VPQGHVRMEAFESMDNHCLMYKCMCTTGYYGYNCELTNNPCGSNPCGLHGSCSAINFNQDFV
jgi:hypothetical protein